MTTHPEVEQLSAHIDGELDQTERARIDAHLPSCAECRSTLAALRAAIADVATLPDTPMDAEQITALDAAVARARSERPRSSKVRRLAWAGGAVAAALVALVVSVQSRPATQDASNGATSAALEHTRASFDKASADGALRAFAHRSAAKDTTGSTSLSAGGSNGEQPAAPLAYSYDAAPSPAARCDAEIRSRTTDARLAATQAARFEQNDAFLLFYEAPSAHPERAELWVVRASDCFVLYFAQTKLS